MIDSLVAPSTEYSSTHGMLGIKVVNRNGVAVPAPRSTRRAPGPRCPRRGTTDANGCVIFQQLPVATYTITVNKGGYVGTDLAPTVDRHAEGDAGTVTFKTIEYDLATTARVTVRTYAAGPVARRCRTPRRPTISLIERQGAPGCCKTYTNAAPATADVAPAVPVQGTAYGVLHRQVRLREPRHATATPNYFGSNPGSRADADPTRRSRRRSRCSSRR